MKIKIANTRLSFPSLFITAKFGGEDTGKYEASFILDKKQNAEAIKELNTAIEALCKAELKTKVAPDKLCLKDGDDSGRDEFHGAMVLKASTKRRPLVITRDKTPISEADNIVYAGCYVNVIATLWAQNNQYGKRINAQLDAVQFARDGEPFGDGGVSPNEFDVLGDDDEDFKF